MPAAQPATDAAHRVGALTAWTARTAQGTPTDPLTHIGRLNSCAPIEAFAPEVPLERRRAALNSAKSTTPCVGKVAERGGQVS